MFTCALHSPTRQYSSRWNSLSRRERATIMQPLKEPSSFCIRSFEAVPELAVGLRAQETKLRAGGADVRFIDGMLSNKSAVDAPRTIVKYAENAWGSSAVGLDFGDVHVGGKPVPLSTRVARGKSYDLHALLSTAVRLNSSAVIALKLDVEGSEWWLLEKLVADTRLLCSISYIFAEFHSTASAQQRERLATYGLESELFEGLKKRVHAAMESPTCKLQIYWRSFWASCGDKQRFEWRTSGQATAASLSRRIAKVASKIHMPTRRLHRRRHPRVPLRPLIRCDGQGTPLANHPRTHTLTQNSIMRFSARLQGREEEARRTPRRNPCGGRGKGEQIGCKEGEARGEPKGRGRSGGHARRISRDANDAHFRQGGGCPAAVAACECHTHRPSDKGGAAPLWRRAVRRQEE